MQNCASLTSLRTTSGEKKEAETHQKNKPTVTHRKYVHACFNLRVLINTYCLHSLGATFHADLTLLRTTSGEKKKQTHIKRMNQS